MSRSIGQPTEAAAAGDFHIRPAQAGDQLALARLEETSPEVGDFTVVVRSRVPYFQLVGRPDERKGFVAVNAQGQIEGATFLLVEDVQFNGGIRRGGYISSVRTSPETRRIGLAARLVQFAEEQARQAGCTFTWAGVIGGNQASLRFFTQRMGYQHLTHLVEHSLNTWKAATLGRRSRRSDALRFRPGTAADAPGVVEAQNEFYAGYQFWVGHNPEQYALAIAHLDRSGLGALWLAETPSGDLRAAATIIHRDKLADIFLINSAKLSGWQNALLRATIWRRPLHIVSSGDLIAVNGDAGALAALLRYLGSQLWPSADLIQISGDERGALGETMRLLGGPTGRLNLLWKGEEALEPDRPLILR